MQDKAERNRITINILTARIIPIILAAVVGYATYVLVALLCINYLLVKHDNSSAAIPILVIYFILFILMTASFIRLVHITVWDPPYLPLGASADRARQTFTEKGKARQEENGITNGEYDPGDSSGNTSSDTTKPQNDPDSPGLELFYTKDVFTCEMDGRPRWCSQCSNWKPDRAHHCSSSGRCILKMDHFCPWVGGPIGENNFKFFVQFTGYTALYCLHLLVVMAIYIHKQIVNKDEEVDRQFCAILGLATFFGLFTAGMTGTSIDLAMNNLTQVEKLGSKTRTHVVAVLKPVSEQLLRMSPNQPLPPTYPEITYPLSIDRPFSDNTPHKLPQGQLNDECSPAPIQSEQPYRGAVKPLEEQSSSDKASPSGEHPHTIEKSPASYLGTSAQEQPRGIVSARDLTASRTFAILRMAQGENPWDLGSSLLNIQTLLGTTMIDWFLPFKRSPCCNHEDPESQFLIGPSVDMLRASVSFIEKKDIRMRKGSKQLKRNPYSDVETANSRLGESRRHRQRRKSHRRSEGTGSFARPSSNEENFPMQMEYMNSNATRTQTT